MEKLMALAKALKTDWAVKKAIRYMQLLLEAEGEKEKTERGIRACSGRTANNRTK